MGERGGTSEAELICIRSGKVKRRKYVTDLPSGRNTFPYQFCFTEMDVLSNGKYVLKACPQRGSPTVMGEIANWSPWSVSVHGPWQAIQMETSPTEELELIGSRLKDFPEIVVSVKRNI